jgi:beta-ureidopropionase / N-carbamoyl-L-amino-acid hydrolase
MGSGLSAAALAAAAAVDETRLWQALMDLATVGARSDGGVCRHALSDEDIAARALVIGWAESRGFEASVDEAANLFIRRGGRDADAAPVLAGSHMDSQPAGGKFDGAYGVLAGLEALIALDEAGIETRRPIDIVAWTNEEGGRYDRSCTGSSVWSGTTELESYLGDIGADGVPLGEALARTLAATPDLPRRPRHWTPFAFIEPHIEQGPVLEAEGLSIAAVTGIQGVRWMNVEVTGKAGHAGTTPMADRQDAVQGALRAIAGLNELMADPQDRVRFTVGRINVTPNSPNTIPEKVLFSIDFRHPDRELLEDRGGQIAQVVKDAASPMRNAHCPDAQHGPDAVSRFDGGPDRGQRRGARPRLPQARLGRLPRCALCRARLSDGDDLHSLPRRALASPGRVGRAPPLRRRRKGARRHAGGTGGIVGWVSEA